MDEEKNKKTKRKHDPFFRWLFADTNHAKTLLEHGEQRGYDLIPTMAIIFYNGRTNWDPFKKLVEGYPEDYRPSMLPFMHAFVNMADIPDSDSLACEDIATGMGVIAMKYAYNKDKLLEVIPQFNEKLRKLPRDEASCLWQKINIYLAEYLGRDIFNELDMAFVSIGQKYGFESAGDYFRKQIAEAEEKGINEGETKGHADAITVLQDMGLPPEKIAEAKARLDALSASQAK